MRKHSYIYHFFYQLAYRFKIVQFVKMRMFLKKTFNSYRLNKNNIIGLFEESLKNCYDISYTEKNPILFAGNIADFDKGTCAYLNELYCVINNNLLYLNEGYIECDENVKSTFACDVMTMPVLLSKEFFVPHLVIEVNDDVLQYIQMYEYLDKAVQRFEGRYKGMTRSYAIIKAYYTDVYLRKIIQSYKPRLVLMWNQFHSTNFILDKICAEYHIECLYMEFGILPGTFSIEELGQMGESYSARFPTDFQNKYFITETERLKAKSIIEYVRINNLNRNSQHNNLIAEQLSNKFKANRPIVLYAGQNDYESGLFPHDNMAKTFHSPIFKTTEEALVYLANIAYENDWNFIYKPHPIVDYEHGCNLRKLAHNVIFVSNVDIHKLIDMSDIVVTVLSQISYISLIRETPVVMLGYTQLKNKGCNYEVFEKEKVEDAITSAIEIGYSCDQKEAFYNHIAQHLKSTLYDNLSHSDYPYGQDILAAADFIKEVVKVQEKA